VSFTPHIVLYIIKLYLFLSCSICLFFILFNYGLCRFGAPEAAVFSGDLPINKHELECLLFLHSSIELVTSGTGHEEIDDEQVVVDRGDLGRIAAPEETCGEDS
jgi:hypothetical protein